MTQVAHVHVFGAAVRHASFYASLVVAIAASRLLAAEPATAAKTSNPDPAVVPVSWASQRVAFASVSFEPTSAYADETVDGWRVRFNARLLLENAEIARKVREELNRQFRAIAEVVPAEKVVQLRKTTIWVERFDPKFPCACYHKDVEWLSENGFNLDKAHGVEIANPENFVAWTKIQPWMVLHELSHGYHDLALGPDYAPLRRAFEDAERRGEYEHVKHANGATVRSYALTNDDEYFAEATEAYFGRNDYYPFTRDDLSQFDHEGFELMKQVWGEPLGR